MAPPLICSGSAPGAWLMPFAPMELEAAFAAMLEAAGKSGCTIDLSLLDDAAMELLHEESLGCSGPTNTLAFPSAPVRVPGRPPLLGSLAFSRDTFMRECFLYAQEPEEHCIRLLAHGLAHLLGHDHGPCMDALSRAMENAALAVCRKI